MTCGAMSQNMPTLQNIQNMEAPNVSQIGVRLAPVEGPQHCSWLELMAAAQALQLLPDSRPYLSYDGI